MVTAYDYPSARAAEAAGVDLVLVGDSGAMTVLGYPSTVRGRARRAAVLATRHPARPDARRSWSATCPSAPTRSATSRRSRPRSASSRRPAATPSSSRAAARRRVARARAIVQAGIPVMGHVGLTPQTSTALGGYKAQGRTRRARRRRSPARRSRSRRPAASRSSSRRSRAAVAAELMPQIDVPVIGIGAGPATDGQVLVFHDLLGIREGIGARFVKRYAILQEEMDAGVAAYAADVRAARYPGPEHGYSIDDGRARGLPRASSPRARRCGQPDAARSRRAAHAQRRAACRSPARRRVASGLSSHRVHTLTRLRPPHGPTVPALRLPRTACSSTSSGGRGNVVRGADLLDQMLDALSRPRGARARHRHLRAGRATGSPTTSTSA